MFAWRDRPGSAGIGGNLGVGTTNPLRQAHIYGSGQATGSLADVGNTGGTLYIQDSGGAVNNGGAILFGAYQGNFAGIKGAIRDGTQNTVGDLVFSTRNSISDTSETERMRIYYNGNVGIGTTPAAGTKLAVNGKITATEVLVSSTPWADYVFAPEYSLAPLSEVSEFIGRNRHLPDIPSATDVEAKGVNLGEMQAKLLAKIEELTLHMIAAERRADRMDKRNTDLEAEVSQLKRTGAIR